MVFAAFAEPIVLNASHENASFRVKVHPKAIRYGVPSSIFKGEILDSVAGEKVALKVFVRSAGSSEAVASFRRELRGLRRIQHRFIVPILGGAELDDLFIIATPWAPNGNLLEYLEAHASVNRQGLLLQVAIATAYLHTTMRLVHGDLKCENVLISADGRALLADFGLSTTVDKLRSDPRTSTSIRMCNTLRFAAPELLSDTAKSYSGIVRSKTPESDVYAFGMLMIQAFTGQNPWPDIKDGSGLLLFLMHPPTHPRPACHGPFDLTDTWWQVCLGCWSRDPTQRLKMPRVKDLLAESLLIDGPAATVFPESKPVDDVSQSEEASHSATSS